MSQEVLGDGARNKLPLGRQEDQKKDQLISLFFLSVERTATEHGGIDSRVQQIT